jgi:hypothetical protein
MTSICWIYSSKLTIRGAIDKIKIRRVRSAQSKRLLRVVAVIYCFFSRSLRVQQFRVVYPAGCHAQNYHFEGEREVGQKGQAC